MTFLKLEKVRYYVRRSIPGLLAQGFTFIALFLPVIFKLPDTVAFLLQVNAIVAFLLQIALLAVELRLPTLRLQRDADRLLRASAMSLALVCAMLGLAGLMLSAINFLPSAAAILCAAAGLLAGQGIYVLGLSNMTRKLDYASMMRGRFVYGVLNAMLTLVCCVAHLASGYFVLAVSVAYVVAAISVKSLGLEAFRGVKPTALFREAQSGARLMVSYGMGGFAANAGSLGLGLAGPLTASWAIACRLMGGFQTIGGNVLGPIIDIGVAEAMQTTRPTRLRKALRTGIVFGAFLTLLFLAGTSAALLWTKTVPSGQHLVALGFGVVGFGAAYVFQSPIARMLGMVGRHSVRLAWDAGRFLTALVPLLFLRGDALIVAFGFQGLVSVVFYIVLCSRYARSTSLQEAPGSKYLEVKP